MRMTVIGCGYLGRGARRRAWRELGHDVIGVDVDEVKIKELAAGRAPFYEPGLPELLERAGGLGPAALHDGHRGRRAARRRRPRPTVHFVCVGTPAAQGRVRRRHLLRRRRGRAPRCRTCARATSSSASPPCRSARRRGWPTTARRARAGRAARLEPRVPPRGLRGRRTPSTPTAWSSACRRTPDAPTAARALLDEVYAAPIARRACPSWSPTTRRRELVKTAANAFLATKISFINAMAEVCEAAGADVVRAGRRDRARRPDRPQVPQRRPRLRRRLPAEGHPGVHGPRRRAGRRPGADLPARGRRDQHAPPASGWSSWPARAAAARSSARKVAVLGRRVQAEQRRHPRLPGAQRRRPAPAAGRGRRRDRPGGDRERPPAVARAAVRRRRARRPARRADAVLVLTEWAEYRALDPVAFGEVVRQPARARRPQRARPRPLAGRRLDLPRAGPPAPDRGRAAGSRSPLARRKPLKRFESLCVIAPTQVESVERASAVLLKLL